MELKLKTKIWNDHGQYNASVPVLFLVGTGVDEVSAIQNLIESYNNYVDKNVVISLIKDNEDDSFILTFKNFNQFLCKNLNVQESAYKRNKTQVDEISLTDYFSAIRSFVPDAEKLIRSSII